MPIRNPVIICVVVSFAILYCRISEASNKPEQELLTYTQTKIKNTSSSTGSISGKITNTSGNPLSNITISIQQQSVETPYGSSFEEMAITDSNGKFKINNLTTGDYIVRADPPSDESYISNDKFDVKVKSGKTTKVKIKLSASSNLNYGYIGSASCLNCHPSESNWQDTAHANTILPPSSETIVAPFDGETITTSDGKVKFKPFIINNIYKVTLYDLTDESISVTYDVARTHGGVAIAGKQRYHVKISNSYYILPIQYNNRNVDENNPSSAWVSYNSSNWYNTDNTLISTDTDVPPDINKSFEQNCEGCHMTGLGITKNIDGEFVSSSNETGIGCESCHGPGGQHVSVGGGKGKYIVNPEYTATDRGNEVCGQCHIRVISKTGTSGADFETEYPCIINGENITPFIPGKILSDYIEETTSDGKSTAGYWNDNNTNVYGENASENNHSQKHRQQYQDFTKSVHYNYSGNKCITCHESHGTGVEGTPQLLKQNDNNKLCIDCHTDLKETTKKNGETYNVHANHQYGSSDVGGSLCTGCHMPKTAKSAVDNDISSHVFDIIKPDTSKAVADYNTSTGITNSPSTVITNSCYGCHLDETDYGVTLWEEWESED
ncbi:MAG TPA: carboxypeptidase regulatory-like domain-containing protein [Candidatus Wujingus californicus]|uniref:carboxypeptidase regulatory-like domain-containing protein n=1 Tax=Candidatus Wujingus californicus TaxID=3367618 RepID=UPI0040264273